MPDSIHCETFPQSNAKKEILAAPSVSHVVSAAKRWLVQDPDGAAGRMGVVIYKSIQANPHLTGREKHAACCQIGKLAVENSVHEAQRQHDPATFLRETTPSVRFLTAVMEDKASRYIQSVTNCALEIGQEHAGDENFIDATRELLQAMDDQKHQISNDACEFLQHCAEAVPGDLGNGRLTLMRNALMLTTTCPSITNATRLTKDTDAGANVAFQANRSVLQYVNSMGGGNEPTYEAAVAIRNGADAAELDQAFQTTFDQIANGDVNALKAGAPASSVADALTDKLNNAQQKLDQRKQRLAEYENQQQAVRQTRKLKQESLDNAGGNASVSDALKQKEAASIEKLDHKEGRIGAKIQRQEEKVARSENRVDQLRSRLGRH